MQNQALNQRRLDQRQVYPAKENFGSRTGPIAKLERGLKYTSERNREVKFPSLGGYTTLVQDEQKGILQNAHLALKGGGVRKIHICLDGKNVLKINEKYSTYSRLIKHCLKALDNPASVNKHTLMWFPGQSDF